MEVSHQEFIKGRWKICPPENLLWFTAHHLQHSLTAKDRDTLLRNLSRWAKASQGRCLKIEFLSSMLHLSLRSVQKQWRKRSLKWVKPASHLKSNNRLWTRKWKSWACLGESRVNIHGFQRLDRVRHALILLNTKWALNPNGRSPPISHHVHVLKSPRAWSILSRRAKLFGWQDTYVFSKAMGEMLLDSLRGDIPVVVLRPSVVESTLAEPFPGWMEGIR